MRKSRWQRLGVVFYLSQEVGGEVLVDAEETLLLGSARESGNRGNLIDIRVSNDSEMRSDAMSLSLGWVFGCWCPVGRG